MVILFIRIHDDQGLNLLSYLLLFKRIKVLFGKVVLCEL